MQNYFMDKVGRNDLCPCGSGKKYKNCCIDKNRADNIIKPDFRALRGGSDVDDMAFAKAMLVEELGYSSMDALEKDFAKYVDYMKSDEGKLKSLSFKEFLGYKPVMEDDKDLLEALLACDDEQEVNNLLSEYMDKSNNSAIDDFLGLSSKQMSVLLSQSKNFEMWVRSIYPIVEIQNEVIHSDVSNLSMVKVFKYIVDEIEKNDGSIKITQTGNFNLALVNKIRKDVFGDSEENIKDCRLYSHQYLEMEIADFTLFFYDLVFTTSSKMKAKDSFFRFMTISEDRMYIVVWSMIFEMLIFYLPWGDLFYYDDEDKENLDFLKDMRMFFFYVMHKLDVSSKGAWIEVSDYVGILKKAHPDFLNEYFFNNVFLREVCYHLGFIEFKDSDDYYERYKFFKCTDLFREVMKWKI